MITEKEYLQLKVDTDRMYESDYVYFQLANKLLEVWEESGLLAGASGGVRKDVSKCLTGYMMDVAGDIGLWRSFIGECRRLYGYPVPFYTDALQDEVNEEGAACDDYIDFELNRSDVRFLVWYSYSFGSGINVMPFDSELLKLSDRLYVALEEAYDDVPRPEGMIKTNDLDLYDRDDAETLGLLAEWMFRRAYLLVPASQSNLDFLAASVAGQSPHDAEEAYDEARRTVPTGPLALFVREWLWLLVRGELPTERRGKIVEENEHPWYSLFREANDGRDIAYFDSYEAMNSFLARAYGWDDKADNLPTLRSSRDFTLLINKTKGMLIARDVARCFKDSANPYYDGDYARENDFSLLVERGRCPIDLVTYALAHGMLDDVEWPDGGEESRTMTLRNADFIARCYLMQYYRAD